MPPCRLSFAVLLILAGQSAFAQSRSPTAKPAASPTSAILDLVPAAHRDAVSKVMAKPTLTAKYTEDAFQAHEAIYPWLLEHPDRVSLAWQRRDVGCVEIKDTGNGSFSWSDPDGSQLTWQAVAKLTDGVVWYATGKVKAAALLPMVPVKAVAVVKYPSKPTDQKGIVTLTPEASVYLVSESRAANAVMRMAGPAAPKMAEEGAEQLLFFFSGIASHIKENPEKAQALLAAKKK
ncbi:hypothetical protein [Limnoglobus roseus]|uniref:GLPGLI family protein n=1 Tax=Limnoglobus roseus TaxID=2598579 RepID=A0A5C1AA39_9BACT|nr:hypothetical protein [Limnoglobus roseus]QEL14682.1 hypothetical protein PX52LOC_01575 [Limnoglobus roseus]